MSKQPMLGILATAIVMAIALGFISLFSFPTFAGWVAYLLLCVIPMQLVIAVTWGGNQPAFAARRNQPEKGVLLLVFALVIGAICAAIYHATAGGQVSPPTPMLAQCTIAAVTVTFFAAIVWGGWPFTAWIKNPLAAGLTLLVACFVVNYILFRIFFNYGFMAGAPVYVPALDPHGLFNAWNALVFYITALAVMFLLLDLDLWPLNQFPSVMQQPVLGLVWTIVCLAVGGIAFYIGVTVMRMDVVSFMVHVPIPVIFGSIIVLNMLQGSLFAKQKPPLKGILTAIAAVVIGNVLALVYGALAPVVTGTVNPGPPTYDFEIWIASAMLSVTFPFLVFYAEFFKFWPLKRAE